MISLTGEYFTGELSRPHKATLIYNGLSEIKIIFREGEIKSAIDSLEVSARLANIPRYMLFPSGGKFVTNDNQAVDQLLKELGLNVKGKWLHRLESQAHFVALSFVLLIAVLVYSVTVVIPRFADETAKLAPTELSQLISSQAMGIFDNSLLRESEIPVHIQDMLHDELTTLAKPYADEFQFHLKFRKSEHIGANAFALPSGEIVITDDLIHMAEDKDEIVAILAHEMGHVIHRHGLRRLFEDSLIAVVIFGVTDDVSTISQAAAALPALLVGRHYSRDFEREADKFAQQIMVQHNIDSRHFSNILSRIDESYKEYPDVSTYFSTHPSTEERLNLFQDP